MERRRIKTQKMTKRNTAKSEKQTAEVRRRFGHRWRVVEYVQMTCPFCSGAELRVYGTRRSLGSVVRYHECRGCGQTFQSRERVT